MEIHGNIGYIKDAIAKRYAEARESIEKDTVTGKSRYEYIISTNRVFDQESFTAALLVLPDIQKVGIQ